MVDAEELNASSPCVELQEVLHLSEEGRGTLFKTVIKVIELSRDGNNATQKNAKLSER